MKNFLFGLFIVLSFTACKKNEEAAPDAGATVAGTYPMTAFGLDEGKGAGYKEVTVTTPPTTASGVMTAVRTDANTISLSAKAAVLTSPTSTTYNVYEIPAGTPVTLQKNGTSYDMFNGGTNVGTADGTNIVLDLTLPASGTTAAGRAVFKGKK